MTRLRASTGPLIAAVSLGGIVAHLVTGAAWPLLAVLLVGGAPLVLRLIWKGARGEFGSDHLAGISIVASALLGEYLAGAIVVLMLSGGETLEAFAVAKATSVLRALASRVPTLAHRRLPAARSRTWPSPMLAVGDEVSILPHEICPVDGDGRRRAMARWTSRI